MAEDLVKGYTGNPSSLVSYNYTLNNPLRYIDPNGLFPVDLLNQVATAYRHGMLTEENVFFISLLNNINNLDLVGLGNNNSTHNRIYNSFHNTAQIIATRPLVEIVGRDSVIQLEKSINSGRIDSRGRPIYYAIDIAATCPVGFTSMWEVKPEKGKVDPFEQLRRYQRITGYEMGAERAPQFSTNGHLIARTKKYEIFMHLESAGANNEAILYRFEVKKSNGIRERVTSAAAASILAKELSELMNGAEMPQEVYDRGWYPAPRAGFFGSEVPRFPSPFSHEPVHLPLLPIMPSHAPGPMPVPASPLIPVF